MASQHWNDSAQAWIDFVDSVDLNRSHVLDGPVKRLIDPQMGMRILDVGCGEGRFCRVLSAEGADVVGLDPTTALLDRARRLDPEGDYVEGFAEALPFEDGSFDVVLSYVTLLDVGDYRKAVSEMARVLRPGGCVVYANLNAFSTTGIKGWMKDKEGNNLCIPVDNYSFEWGAIVEWRGIRIVNFHRPMCDIVQAFLASGLALTAFEEPLPTPEAITEHPRLAEYLRVRHFVVMKWTKP